LLPGNAASSWKALWRPYSQKIFLGRVLPFDGDAATAYARIAAERKRMGRPISQCDAQIAAIAHSRGRHLATRNVDDFEGCGLCIVNPWQM